MKVVRKTLGSHELYVKANSVAIENVKTNTYITVSTEVFLTLLRNRNIISLKFKELCLLNNEYVNYFLYLGDGWVVYGNKFFDLRKYYGSMPYCTEGMKLSLLDWTSGDTYQRFTDLDPTLHRPYHSRTVRIVLQVVNILQ
jgi:hypothetical protein